MNAAVELPRALQPWQDWLQWFRPHLAMYLGGLLQTLEPRLGRQSPRSAASDSDFDGLGDIQRKGRYERLVSTEWLLAQEVPEEFLRRAASQELLFLAPSYRSQRADRHVLVLADVGPLQLGAPRLVQMASLIVLARRASAQGGRLQWGTAQQPGQVSELTRSRDLSDFLEARSWSPASPEAMAQWQTWISQELQPHTEVWWLGAQAFASDNRPGARALHQLLLNPGLAPGQLDAELRCPASRTVFRIDLPDGAQGATLLKGRFLQPPPVAGDYGNYRFSLLKAPLLSPDGRLLVLPALDQSGMLSLRLSVLERQANKAKFKLHAIRQQLHPLALKVTSSKGGIAGLLQSGSALLPWGLVGSAQWESLDKSALQINSGTPRWPPMYLCEAPRPPGTKGPAPGVQVLLLDDGQRLVNLNLKTVVATHVLASVPLYAGLAVVRCRPLAAAWQTSLQIITHDGLPGREFQVPGIEQELDHAWFASCAPVLNWQRAWAGRVKASQSDRSETWLLNHKMGLTPRPTTVQLQPGQRAHGAWVEPNSGLTQLVVVTADKMHLMLMGAKPELLYSSARKIVHCVVAPDRGIVAMVTQAAELLVYELPHRRLLVTLANASPGDTHHD